MFGNFCSAECAAAYNFDTKYNSNEIWERYSLINYLYGTKNNMTIKIALPRLSLKKWGGRFSIEEFRQFNSSSRDYKLVIPPMISVIPTLEEITIDTDSNNFKSFDPDFITKTSNELRLKRSKPLPSYKNTLENCMNLKYV